VAISPNRRIAIETLVHNIAFPDLNTAENVHAEQKNTTEKSSTNTDSIITKTNMQ